MSAVSGVSPAGFSPTDMLEKINERFQVFDVDKSGTLSKSELTDVRSAKGLDTSKIDKVFNWLDIDGDSVVSQEEHEIRLLAMAERAGGHQRLGESPQLGEYSGPGDHSSRDVPGAREIFGALKTLLESIDSPPADSDQLEQLQDLSQKIDVEGFSEDNLSALVAFLTSIVPPIDSTV